MTHPPPPEPDAQRLANGTGYAGFAVALLSVVLFFVPFVDLMLALGGLVYCGRAVFLGRRRYLTDGEPVDNGVALAMAGVLLGTIGLVVGAIFTYSDGLPWLTLR